MIFVAVVEGVGTSIGARVGSEQSGFGHGLFEGEELTMMDSDRRCTASLGI